MPRANAEGSVVSTATRSIEPSRRPLSTSIKPVDVHRLGQAIVDRLPHERVIHRHLDVAGRQVLRTGDRRGKARGQQVVGAHAQDRRRRRACRPRMRSSSSDRVAFQRQRDSNIGWSSTACVSTFAHGVGVQVVEHLFEREAVLRAEREDDRLFVGRRLQLEAEAAAEALAQREPPGAVDAPAERGVQDELHAAALVEEALEDDALLRRHGAEHAPAVGDVLGDLHRGFAGRADLVAGAPAGRAHLRAAPRSPPTARAVRAGPSPSQNGIVGGWPLASATRTMPALDLQDPPRRVAELEDVADVRFDGEVLVERADERALGLLADLVVGDVGDRAAAGDRGEAGALAAP